MVASIRKVVALTLIPVIGELRRERVYWMIERGSVNGGNGTGCLRLRKVLVCGQ